MATPCARMRLSIEVLPLVAENAHGPYGAYAMAAFKARRFALPVRPEDTFELVWAQIEQRYKKNYLDAQQAANFTITKLQDAYDCDLDLGDTVSDIFEGEPDPTMRVVKVVPSFVDRDFSVPPTSNLRPVREHNKRMRESSAASANKRQRRQTDEDEDEARDGDDDDQTRDRPAPSTELLEPHMHATAHMPTVNGSRAASASANANANVSVSESVSVSASRATSSHTQASLVFVDDAQTGLAEFGPVVKEESPELDLLPPPHRPAHKPRAKRRDIYDLPSSQEDAHVSLSPVTLHRLSAARTPTTVQKEVNLLNSSRQRATQSSDLTSAFLSNTGVHSKPTPTKTMSPVVQARMDRILRTRKRGISRPPEKAAEEEPEPAPTTGDEPKSPSASVACSPPSSPSASHHPARFLSHSPTVEKEATVEEEEEEEEEEDDEDEEDASENSSSSADDQSSSEDDTEEQEEKAQLAVAGDQQLEKLDASVDEAAEMPDTTVNGGEHAEAPDATGDKQSKSPEEPVVIHLPSSPPRLNGTLASIPQSSESSQLTPSQLNPPVRQTPIPLPANITRTPLSSQLSSAKATAQRPSARYTGFRTLREQLADAETTTFASGGNSYDPRTIDLTKLVAKAPGKPIPNGVKFGVDEDSEDESSSSSSSSSSSNSDSDSD